MKKFLVFFIVLTLAAGFAVAQEEAAGLGLTAGLEFGVENVSKADNGDASPYLKPRVLYENAFLDGALDVSAELYYKFGFEKTPNEDRDDVFPQDLYFDLALGYNLALGENSTLSFLLENENDTFVLSPRFDESNNAAGVLIPGVKFNQTFGFGDLYAQAGVPLYYLQEDKDADFAYGLDFTVGWASTFGLGLELVQHTGIKPESGYEGLDIIVSYENGPVYAEVEVDTYKDMEAGVTVIPEISYALNPLNFYINCEFDGIGADTGDVTVSPALGVKYSF